MSTGGRPLVSVVVPVFNEAETVAEVLDQLMELDYPPVDFEIVVVESNSSDGTREIVEQYADHPRARLVFQDEPMGKGNAVRAGLAKVSGDIILIQDGDLEYRISEYPLLLDPILTGKSHFVLGCRHIPGERMRDMPEQPMKGLFLNAAHWGFTALFDLTYGVWIRDPFTMFKVFRRECIEGLEFVSDRFDFDWELIGKLVRRGYKPIEVPITYKARSFHAGKKVRLFADPPTWVVACFRFRFARIPGAVPSQDLTDVTDRSPIDVPLPENEIDLRVTQVP